MEEQNQSFNDLDDVVLKKLDGGFRQLLRIRDEEIIDGVNLHTDRLKESISRIEEIQLLIPPSATDEDRQSVARLKDKKYAHLAPDAIYGPVVVDKLQPKLIKTRAIIKFAGNRDDLSAMGLEVGMQAQDIFTVVGTRHEMVYLAAQVATLRICMPRPMLPSVKHASAQAEIDQVHKPRSTTPKGFQGKDVIVGIVDTALDVTHNGFREPTGSHESRVLYYWVQRPDHNKAPGQTPQQFDSVFMGLDRGRLYTKADINKALVVSGGPYGNGKDLISKKPGKKEHGTHVAGIATGNGCQADWKKTPVNVGAAPKADIIHVCYGFDSNNPPDYPWDNAFEDSILEAIDFIFKAAKKEKKPAVVNCSLAIQMGPHNGTTLLDQGRDNLVNSYIDKERCIVWSAGNSNDDKGFEEGNIPAGKEKGLEFKIHPVFGDNATVLDIWYSGPELDYKFKHMQEEKGWYKAGQEYDPYKQGFVNLHKIYVHRDTEEGGGLHNLRFIIVIPNPAKYQDKIDKPWTITLRNPANSGNVNYYAWVGFSGAHGSLKGASLGALTLADTACGKSILTVGACEKHIPPNPTSGEKIGVYSGAGPTLDGRIKPEIVAVGGTKSVLVTSATSNQASGYHGDWGTSMAAPLAAGGVALLFEEYYLNKSKGGLGSDDIKALLTQTTHKAGLHLDPMKTNYVAKERNQYGYGRLRMLAPVDHSAPLVDVDVWIRTAVDDYGKQPFIGDIYWAAPDIHVRKPQSTKDLNKIKWGESYSVVIKMHNLGTSDAVDCILCLKYTLPFTAPSKWTQAKNKQGVEAKSKKFTIPALNHFVITFEWKPDKNDFVNPTSETHFCLLALIDHSLDKLKYAEGAAGVDAWERNIKGTNNIALQNMHIYD